jgi:hypothetical protein
MIKNMNLRKISMQKELTGKNSQQTLFAEKLTAINSLYPPGSEREKIEDKFKNHIHEELTLGSVVSYVGNKNVPFLRIYRYKEAFAFDFVMEFLRRFEADSGDYVFDPFSGSGTTIYTAMISGIPSVGIDKLPIAYFNSKTLPLLLLLKENELKEIWTSLIPKIQRCEPADVALDVPIMKIAFDEETFVTLRKLKSAIAGLSQPYCDILLLLFFSIVEECSFTSKDGQFLRLNRNKNISRPIDAMNRKIAQVEEDVRRLKLRYPDLLRNDNIMPDVYLGDTRDLSGIKFEKRPTIMITSPPYANRYDYTRTYALELCFHFVRNFEELKAIRFGILRSHIESKIRKDEAPPHTVIKEVVEILRRKRLNNTKIPRMITTYFIDMQKVIAEWFKVLAPGANVAMVVDNVRFEGELIPVDLVLSEMAEDVGFEVRELIVARYKGNSSQQMKKYGRVPVRESIVIWER